MTLPYKQKKNASIIFFKTMEALLTLYIQAEVD